jgi:DNA modification methylase
VKKEIIKRANLLSGKKWLEYSFSIWRDLGKTEEERKLKHPAIFTVKLILRLIDVFTSHPNSIILDPFAGSGTTLIAGLLRGMHVIGFDINPKFRQSLLERIQNRSFFNFEEVKYEYLIFDSRNLSEKIISNSIDLCITSPPYWDILNRKRTADNKQNINYTNLLEDLGNIKDYSKFLVAIKQIFTEVHKVLKPKHYFIVNVMDLRKKDRFYPLHIDTSNIAQEVGFNFEDIIIWDRQKEYNNMRPLGYPYKFIINKVHEYLLVFRKL